MKYFTDSVECLNNGAPHEKEANEFYAFFKKLDSSPKTFFLRCFITSDLFQKTEKLKSDIHFKMADYRKLLSDELSIAVKLEDSMNVYNDKLTSVYVRNEKDDRKFTQSHYGNLFKNFSEYHYYEEPFELLSLRLKRNKIKLNSGANFTALDCGCGGGRYTLALKKLGFGKVVGADYSPINIQTATHLAGKRKIKNVSYQKADVLKLPFNNNSFDFVFCNGVLHHSRSISQGIREMIRVMKPGGTGWLYLINKPGGIHWDTVELLRNVMKGVDPVYARNLLRILGVPENRVFHILDHIMVPINTLSSSSEIEKMLADNSVTNFQRLERGTDFDLSERLYQLNKSTKRDQETVWKYGPGEHRYYFHKPAK